MRVVFVTNIVPDYRLRVFRQLHAELGADLRIFVSQPLRHSCMAAQRELPLVHVPALHLTFATHHRERRTVQREPLALPWLLPWQLLRFAPEAIVAGDFGVRTLLCWLAARVRGARLLIWSEDIAASAVGRSRLQKRLRRWLCARADGFLAWGLPAADYLRSLGASDASILVCDQAVDNDWWMAHATAVKRERARQALGLDGTVFLLVGRMLALKGFEQFLRAWAKVPAGIRTPVLVLLVGDGPERASLKALSEALALTRVRFEGSKSPEELAAYYAAADVFVLPSLQEVWGLVVNEALCFGLPVLASRYAGAAQQLIDGRGGELCDPLDIEAFARRLCRWAAQPPARDLERQQSIVGELRHDNTVRAILQALGSSRSAPLASSALGS